MKFTQYLLSTIFIIVGLTCYMLAIAERDSQMNLQNHSIQGTL